MSNKSTINVLMKKMAEVVLAVFFIYFLLGGKTWPSWVWAGMTIFTALIIIINERRGNKQISGLLHNIYIELIITVILLVSGIWSSNWGAIIMGLIVGLISLSDLRTQRQRRSKMREDTFD